MIIYAAKEVFWANDAIGRVCTADDKVLQDWKTLVVPTKSGY